MLVYCQCCLLLTFFCLYVLCPLFSLSSSGNSNSNPLMAMKLVVDREIEKVLFAEVGKCAAGFLLCLLALSQGTVVQMLTSNTNVISCSFPILHWSLKAMDVIFVLDLPESKLLNLVMGFSSYDVFPLWHINTSRCQRFWTRWWCLCRCRGVWIHLFGWRRPLYRTNFFSDWKLCQVQYEGLFIVGSQNNKVWHWTVWREVAQGISWIQDHRPYWCFLQHYKIWFEVLSQGESLGWAQI